MRATRDRDHLVGSYLGADTAARLQASASGGEIVMCAATYKAVAGTYPAAEPQRLQLKGKRSTVQGFRIRIE